MHKKTTTVHGTPGLVLAGYRLLRLDRGLWRRVAADLSSALQQLHETRLTRRRALRLALGTNGSSACCDEESS